MSVSPPTLSWLESELHRLDTRGLRRRLTSVQAREPGRIRMGSGWLDDFSGNDYLGLTRHPDMQDAAREALTQGCGAGGSRVVTGGGPPHGKLEERLRHFTGEDNCLVFPSGYQANLGVVSALCQPGDTIYSDAHNHASIVDGCRLSGARVRVYPHREWETLEAWLIADEAQRRWIITDTVFSMDGSLAPLAQLSRLAETHQAGLLVDEAHAMGVLGPGGRGCCAEQGVRPLVLMGTFSKGLGSHGAFTASDAPVAEWLLNRARSFIYTTALPPAVVGASREALALSAGAEGDRLRRRVLGLALDLRNRLRQADLSPSGEGTPIVSLAFDDPRRASRLQQRLMESGHLAWAFRPPTVPAGTSRLRICLSAAHQPVQVDRLADSLVALLGADPPPHGEPP